MQIVYGSVKGATAVGNAIYGKGIKPLDIYFWPVIGLAIIAIHVSKVLCAPDKSGFTFNVCLLDNLITYSYIYNV